METRNFKRVLVWELPVRIFHWLNAAAITILIITGFLIAYPPALLSDTEATHLHTFGIIRATHFIAGYVFFLVMILRIYWAFVGNRFASWKAFSPFSKKNWMNFMHVMKVDVVLLNEKHENVKNVSIGHNSVAAFSYVAMFIIALIMVFTGFGLYADMASWWLPKLFSGVPAFFGGDFLTREIHHITMWVFIFFIMVHVYLVFYHDWLEGRGEVSSMFGGYKFVCEDRLKKAEAQYKTSKKKKVASAN